VRIHLRLHSNRDTGALHSLVLQCCALHDTNFGDHADKAL
jgi:hypothetical protein